ncbi:MAG: response regulator [Acidothermus sp.]|nr:response regulator [Acidothermus sp.]MCL6537207.1 response regulator [Acidothermus sp.]
MIVDDDDVIRRLMRVNLELEGFVVDEAADAEQCLSILRGARPDVLVVDVAMPGIDGITLTQMLRADPATAGIRILIVSALAQRDDVERGLQAGADAYLTKPFDPDAFVAQVRRLSRPADSTRGADPSSGASGHPRRRFATG